MDDNQNGEALNPQTVADTATESPAVQTEVPTEKVESEATAEQETGSEEGSKKGAQSRIRELSSESKAKEETIKSLQEQIAELTGSVDSSRQQPTYSPQVQPGQEISPEQYQNDIATRADAIVQLRLQQERLLTKINSEAMESVQTYSQLNPKSDQFDKDLSESVSQAALAYTKSNPTGSLKKFVDGLMKPYQKSIDAAKGQAEVEVAKEQAKAALRPTQVNVPEKSASEMSIAELGKKLGIVY